MLAKVIRHVHGKFTYSGFGLGIAYWFLDAWVVTAIFENGEFFDLVINPGADDITRRLFTAGLFIAFGVVTNITVHRLRMAQSRLRQSEEHFRLLSEAAFEGIVVSEGFEIRDANSQMTDALGYSREELIGMNALDLVAPESRDVVRESIASGNVEPYELLALRKDGSKVPAEARGRSVSFSGRTLRLSAMRDISDRKAAAQESRDNQRRLRALASELSLAEEKVRRRIAVELHDSVGQHLSAVRMKLGALVNKQANGSTETLIGIGNMVDEVISQTRSIMFDLSPPMLYDLGIREALEWLAENMCEKHRYQCRVEVNAGTVDLGQDVRIAIFQMIRELLQNVAKHANAQQVHIKLDARDQYLDISVTDDGCGFDAGGMLDRAGRTGSFGLFSIHERLVAVGGTLKIESDANTGTAVFIILPLSQG
jgi:PAS domain S-box-containing protein